MRYDITPSETGRYLVCRVTGPLTVTTARTLVRDVDRRSRSRQVKRILSDLRDAPSTLDTLATYRFAYTDMAALALQRDVRVALLVHPDDPTHAFTETVVRNAGYDLRPFHTEPAALAWLTEDPPVGNPQGA